MAEARIDDRAEAASAKPARPSEPARTKRAPAPKPSPIIPATGVAGRPLFLVVTVMCYLVCITLGGSLLVQHQIEEWTADISAQVTVQVRPIEGVDIDDQVANAVALLVSTDGVIGADPMSVSEASELLEPWLGSGNVLKDLPIPRLVAVEIDRENPPDLEILARRLETDVAGAAIDDHRRWQSGLTRMASSLRVIAIGVITLVAITTMAMIVFATRAAMSGNREIIEVLHMIGATQSFIAYQIQKRFFLLGLISGLISAVFAVLTFLALNRLAGTVAEGSFTGNSASLMFGPLALPWTSYALFLVVPLAAAIIGVVTSRIAVIGVLRQMA